MNWLTHHLNGFTGQARHAFPRWAWLRHVGLVVAACLIVHVAALWLAGRPLTCPCGHVSLWQLGQDPAENSQQLADFYSLLHAAFGMLCFVGLSWLRPRWPAIDLCLLTLISSTLWEVAENSRWAIALLSNATNAAPPYHGDSVLNSLADSAFSLIGFALASRLGMRWALAAALALEVFTTLMIHDGIAVAAYRLMRDAF